MKDSSCFIYRLKELNNFVVESHKLGRIPVSVLIDAVLFQLYGQVHQVLSEQVPYSAFNASSQPEYFKFGSSM